MVRGKEHKDSFFLHSRKEVSTEEQAKGSPKRDGSWPLLGMLFYGLGSSMELFWHALSVRAVSGVRALTRILRFLQTISAPYKSMDSLFNTVDLNRLFPLLIQPGLSEDRLLSHFQTLQRIAYFVEPRSNCSDFILDSRRRRCRTILWAIEPGRLPHSSFQIVLLVSDIVQFSFNLTESIQDTRQLQR